MAVLLHNGSNRGNDEEAADERDTYPRQDTCPGHDAPGRPGRSSVFPSNKSPQTDQAEKKERLTENPDLGRKPRTSPGVPMWHPDHIDERTGQRDHQTSYHRWPAHAISSGQCASHPAGDSSSLCAFQQHGRINKGLSSGLLRHHDQLVSNKHEHDVNADMTYPAANHRPLPLIHERPDKSAHHDASGEK